VDRFHASALHGGRCAACCEVLTNFADESACLTADNVRNEVVTIRRSEEVSTRRRVLHINCFFINTGTTILLALTAHQTPIFTGFSNCVAVFALDVVTSVS
jgi:hypothetical protein